MCDDPAWCYCVHQRSYAWRSAYSNGVLADLGLIMLLPEELDLGWIPVFKADGIWDVVC